jgi:hypothetical protein
MCRVKLFSCHITTLLVVPHEIDDEGSIRCPGTVNETTQLADMFFTISIVITHSATLWTLNSAEDVVRFTSVLCQYLRNTFLIDPFERIFRDIEIIPHLMSAPASRCHAKMIEAILWLSASRVTELADDTTLRAVVITFDWREGRRQRSCFGHRSSTAW